MKVTGVFRLGDNKRALGVSFASEPTDDELRVFHDSISSPSPVVEVAQGGGIRIVKPATPIDQSALIRELVLALERLAHCADAFCDDPRINAPLGHANETLSRVPEEYRG